MSHSMQQQQQHDNDDHEHDNADKVVVEEFSEGRFHIMEVKESKLTLGGEEGDTVIRNPIFQQQTPEFPLHTAPFLATKRDDGPEQVQRKPVVFLCGWASAPDEELKQYANFYTMEFGVSTLRGSCPAMDMFLDPSGLEAFTIEGLRVLHEYFNGRPVIFHVLSCGGFHVYNEIQKQWDEINPVVPQASKILGVILDHCPHAYNTRDIATAMSERLPHWTMQYAVSWTVNSVLSLFWNQTGEYSEHCQIRERRLPQLYVYSKQDRQVSVSTLEQHIRERGTRGTASVQSIAFDSSEHLGGLEHYTKPYKMAIHNFIVLCLSFSDKSVEEFFMPTGATYTSIKSNAALGDEESGTGVENFGQGVLLPQDNHIILEKYTEDGEGAEV